MQTQVLFVCADNTCRSPLALAAWRALAATGKTPPGMAAQSAGLQATEGDSAAHYATEVARQWSQDLSDHQSQPLTDELVQSARAILVMTTAQAEIVQVIFPEAATRVLVLGNFAGEDDGTPDIADPIGGPREAYAACADRIYRAVQNYAAQLQP